MEICLKDLSQKQIHNICYTVKVCSKCPFLYADEHCYFERRAYFYHLSDKFEIPDELLSKIQEISDTKTKEYYIKKSNDSYLANNVYVLLVNGKEVSEYVCYEWRSPDTEDLLHHLGYKKIDQPIENK